MSIYDGGWPQPPEDEAEGKWVDPEDADDSWRGDVHTDDWPEDDAGPEYRFYKKRLEEGEDK